MHNNSNNTDNDNNRYMVDEARSAKKDLDLSGWTDYVPADVPQQFGSVDCGVFVCKYAECASQNRPFDFSQLNMLYFRYRMVLEIQGQALL